MKTSFHFLIFILVSAALCVINSPELAIATPPDDVQGLTSTAHAPNIPSNTTTINMEWTVPDGYTGYYYTSFTSASAYTQYTFDEDNTAGLLQIENGFTSYNHTGDDDSYYFHIVPVWLNDEEDEEFGNTSSYGPMIIDTTSPTGSIVADDITSSPNITLSFISDDAVKMHVSNIGFGEGAELDFVDSMPWELTSEEGEKWVYVQFKDNAGNTYNTKKMITLSSNTSPAASSISQQYSPKNTTLSIAFSITDNEGGDITITASSNKITLIGTENLSITGVGGSSENNMYTVTATAEENIPLTLTINPVTNVIGPSTITLTVTDAGGLTATTSFNINIYAKGDVDGDGVVELDDVEKTFYFYTGLRSPTVLEKYIINVVDDNEDLSLQDFRGVFQLYTGL